MNFKQTEAYNYRLWLYRSR